MPTYLPTIQYHRFHVHFLEKILPYSVYILNSYYSSPIIKSIYKQAARFVLKNPRYFRHFFFLNFFFTFTYRAFQKTYGPNVIKLPILTFWWKIYMDRSIIEVMSVLRSQLKKNWKIITQFLMYHMCRSPIIGV